MLREMLSAATDELLLFSVRTPGSTDRPLDDLEILMPPFLKCFIYYHNYRSILNLALFLGVSMPVLISVSDSIVMEVVSAAVSTMELAGNWIRIV